MNLIRRLRGINKREPRLSAAEVFALGCEPVTERKIVEYELCYGPAEVLSINDVNALGRNVVHMVAEGWQPLGGVSFDPSGAPVQAMVRYEQPCEECGGTGVLLDLHKSASMPCPTCARAAPAPFFPVPGIDSP